MNFASVLRESRNDEHPVEMLVGIMDVEMGRTVDEADAAADEAVEDCARLPKRMEWKNKNKTHEKRMLGLACERADMQTSLGTSQHLPHSN